MIFLFLLKRKYERMIFPDALIEILTISEKGSCEYIVVCDFHDEVFSYNFGRNYVFCATSAFFYFTETSAYVNDLLV